MPATRVLVKGLAGSGKTTLLTKLAYTWSQQERDSPLFKFDLVFVLSLREVLIGCSLIDAIFQQILPDDTEVSQNGLKTFIKSHPSRVLILLDGFDEYMAKNLSSEGGNIEKIISFKDLRDCRIILSTRPYQHMGSRQSYYIPVKLTGFSPANVRLYMMKFFCGNTDMIEGLIERISQSEMLKSLSTIPVFLMLLCLLWEDDQTLPITQSELYQQFTLYLWRKYCVRHRKQVNFDEEGEDFERELNRAISRLGEVALDGLLPQENVTEEKLIFSEKDFDDSFQLGCEMGLLTRERLRSKLNSLSIVTFLHKSFQEFCAAKFVGSTDQFNGILKQLQTWDVLLSKIEMIKFCCGVVGNTRAIAIIQYATALYRKIVNEHDEVYIGMLYSGYRGEIFPIMNMLYESQIKYDDNLITALKSLMSVGELNVGNFHPQVLPIFHYYVKSAFGLATLTAIKSVRFQSHPCDSLDAITDTLTCMPDVQSVHIKFELGDTSAVNENSINHLGVQIAGLSKLNEIQLWGPLVALDISILLHHLSESPNSCNLKSIEFGVVVLNPTNMVQFISNLNNLESLYLRGIEITSTSMGPLLDAIHSKLKRLTLIGIDIAEAIGHICHIVPHLKELRLIDASLSDDHIRILCEFLPKASNLEALNLSGNTLGMAIVPLAHQLQYCKKLEELDLNATELKEDQIKTLGEFLPKASNLQILILSHNTVGMAIVPLAQQLQYCNKLEVLDSSYAHITDQGVIELADRFASLPNLKKLKIKRNDCKNTGLDAVFKHLPHLNKLEDLRITATVDNQCSTLVRDCLADIGKVIPDKAISIEIGADKISSIQQNASKHLKL